jgi:hypothetical protein
MSQAAAGGKQRILDSDGAGRRLSFVTVTLDQTIAGASWVEEVAAIRWIIAIICSRRRFPATLFVVCRPRLEG